MSILKMTCPHCKSNYVLPENKVPWGKLTLTCPFCQKTYEYEKPDYGAKKRVPAEEKQAPAPEPEIPKEEPEKVQDSSVTPTMVSGVESRSVEPEPTTPPEEPRPVQPPMENISEAPPVEKKPSKGWQPVIKEEPAPVQAPPETPAVQESVFVRYEHQEMPKQVQAPAEPVSKAPVSIPVQTPPPAPKPVKKVKKKPLTGAKPVAGKKWIMTVLAIFIIGATVASIAVFKPAVVTGAKEMYGVWSVKIKEGISSLNEKPAPKPNITEPVETSTAPPPEPVIMRPSKFNEISGTWTGSLRSDRRGPKWTFSFNPANYEVSIKNDSGLRITGTAVYHWDKGSLIGDTLRVAPNWNVLDMDITKSSVSEYEGTASLGAFSRKKNNLKLCMSHPGKMIDPTETNSSGDIQCFDLKKK